MKDGGPAFPCEAGMDFENQKVISHSRGMSLRDWFAGKALGKLIQNVGRTYGDVAHECYCYADAMLAEREKTNGT